MGNWLSRFQKNKSIETTRIDLRELFYQPVFYVNSRSFRLGNVTIQSALLQIDSGEHTYEITMQDFANALHKYGGGHPLQGGIVPQLSSVIYEATNNMEVMSSYFPITKKLIPAEFRRFQNMLTELLGNTNFVFRVWDANGKDITKSSPASLSAIVAGHLVEIFFYRDDLWAHFFSEPRFFNIYINSQAYEVGGGLAGGCYDLKSQSIKLVASRLYEGFYRRTPGVAPFLHEFGHMFDSFNIATSKMGVGRGLLPCMFESDGTFFSPDAREQFIKGKQLEQERYEQARHQKPDDSNLIPLGHPYVFQNDGEFIAGYLEMFFRNPNRFAELNPTLFAGFVATFRQDPREFWEQDFEFYIEENRKVYLEHRQGIHPSGLKVFS